VVDPIDGTRAFARGDADWTVAIGIVVHGVAVAGFVFAPACEDDFERLLDLRILVMRAHLERLGRFDPGRARQRFRDAFDPAHMRLIMVEGELAGCVALLPEPDGLELSNFYIHPSRQGAGLGSGVLSALLAETDAAGSAVRLQVLKQSPAARLYERHGFRYTHEDEFDLFYHRAANALS
jgi:ribosomal protein S18 acetylase RimI-like enzyme